MKLLFLIIFNCWFIFKYPKIYGMDRITTEEVMDNLDMIKYIFGKIDESGWWDLDIISADADT